MQKNFKIIVFASNITSLLLDAFSKIVQKSLDEREKLLYMQIPYFIFIIN